MFETLTERLGASFSFFKNKKELTEANVDEGLAADQRVVLAPPPTLRDGDRIRLRPN